MKSSRLPAFRSQQTVHRSPLISGMSVITHGFLMGAAYLFIQYVIV